MPPVYAARTLRLEKVSAERWREVPIAQGQPAATPQAAVADAFERTRTTDMALDAAWLELLGEPAAVVVEPAPAAPALDTMIADLLGDPVAELIG